jgi:hypothetical protein
MAAIEQEIPSSSSSDKGNEVSKEPASHVEQIHTNERVPGHPGYYEKNGVRTYGDEEDHDHEPPVSHLILPNVE